MLYIFHIEPKRQMLFEIQIYKSIAVLLLLFYKLLFIFVFLDIISVPTFVFLLF